MVHPHCKHVWISANRSSCHATRSWYAVHDPSTELILWSCTAHCVIVWSLQYVNGLRKTGCPCCCWRQRLYQKSAYRNSVTDWWQRPWYGNSWFLSLSPRNRSRTLLAKRRGSVGVFMLWRWSLDCSTKGWKVVGSEDARFSVATWTKDLEPKACPKRLLYQATRASPL